MKDINVINFFEENNINFSSNFNLGVTNLPSKLDFGKDIFPKIEIRNEIISYRPCYISIVNRPVFSLVFFS